MHAEIVGILPQNRAPNDSRNDRRRVIYVKDVGDFDRFKDRFKKGLFSDDPLQKPLFQANFTVRPYRRLPQGVELYTTEEALTMSWAKRWRFATYDKVAMETDGTLAVADA